jgi:hypothetical protein
VRCSVVIVIGSKPERFEGVAAELGAAVVAVEAADAAPWPSVSWTDARDGRTIGRDAFARFCRHATAWRMVASLDGAALVLEDGTDVGAELVDALD